MYASSGILLSMGSLSIASNFSSSAWRLFFSGLLAVASLLSAADLLFWRVKPSMAVLLRWKAPALSLLETNWLRTSPCLVDSSSGSLDLERQ